MTQTDTSKANMPHTGAPALIVTGMSGAGKTTVLHTLEDLGYESVDNLPMTLLPAVIGAGLSRPLAVGIDVRTRDFDPSALIRGLETSGTVDADGTPAVSLLFLDCDDTVLIRRYTETRRRHPLAIDRPLQDGLVLERRILEPLRGHAAITLDTSALTLPELKQILEERFAPGGRRTMAVQVLSFAFSKGLPRHADLVFDVRFLKNPHYDPALREKTGQDAGVGAYVAADTGFDPFFAKLTDLLDLLLPRYQAEGKSYLSIAIGCTGGRHRSVYVAERLAQRLEQAGRHVRLKHRELGR